MRLYFKSLSLPEQKHVVDAYVFELSKVQRKPIRERVVHNMLANIDANLAKMVADKLGIALDESQLPPDLPEEKTSAKLSMTAFLPPNIEGRKIAVLVHPHAATDNIEPIHQWALKENVMLDFLTPTPAPTTTIEDDMIPSDGMQQAEPSVLYDAVIVLDGNNLDAFKRDGVACHYVIEAYKHLKPVVLLGDKAELLEHLRLPPDEGVFSDASFQNVAEGFKEAIRHNRVWAREAIAESIPA